MTARQGLSRSQIGLTRQISDPIRIWNRFLLICVRGPSKTENPYIDHFLIRGCVLIPPRIGGFLVHFGTLGLKDELKRDTPKKSKKGGGNFLHFFFRKFRIS